MPDGRTVRLTEVARHYGVRDLARLAGREAMHLVRQRLVHRSYSQHGEDRLAWHLLGRQPRGTFVDLGANDPVRLSNTYLLYRRGWRGLAVDASADHAGRWAAIRPADRFVVAGVGPATPAAPFYVHAASALSTFSAEHSDRAVAEGHPRVAVRQVPVRALADLLDEHLGDRPIDFLSLDLEGADVEALASNDWHRFRPRLICVEVTATAAGSVRARQAAADPELDALLGAHGYAHLASCGVNAFYATPAATRSVVSGGTPTGHA